MKKHIQLFTGDNEFLLREELKKYKASFIEKYGKEHIFEYHTDNFDPASIMNALASGGLFAIKKLVIIHGLPPGTDKTIKISAEKVATFEEAFAKAYEQISEDTILLFIAPKADKRTKNYKEMTARDLTIKFFDKPKNEKERHSIISQHLDQRLGTLNSSAITKFLIEECGDNLYTLQQEARKLKAFAVAKNLSSLTPELIDSIVIKQTSANSFALFAALFTNRTKVLSLLKQAQDDQTNRNQYLGLVYRGIKNMLIAQDWHEQGKTSSALLAQTMGIPPQTAGMMINMMPQLLEKKDILITCFNSLIDLDVGIKTGKYPEQYFRIGITSILLTLSA